MVSRYPLFAYRLLISSSDKPLHSAIMLMATPLAFRLCAISIAFFFSPFSIPIFSPSLSPSSRPSSFDLFFESLLASFLLRFNFRCLDGIYPVSVHFQAFFVAVVFSFGKFGDFCSFKQLGEYPFLQSFGAF